ncbi:hypothetical protein GA0070610_2982 [Micromonospora echinofusca]|uniref:Uncharacterized protein n=1 Tax=Micromonospora echinofusca TaxID=47858 RepID=A0A1C5GAH8_MICEH|nr:hypothetical protein GA0070610_2982 [Micromonospora echinofusca]
MGGRHRRVRPALATLPALVLLATGCTSPPAAPQPSPEPVPTTRPGTVARAEVGDRLTMTAAVDRIITDTAFVVRDEDLTGGILLVLTTGPSAPAAPQLVTVRGTVIRFSHGALSARYRLGSPEPYRAFEGGRALVAQDLKVWQ